MINTRKFVTLLRAIRLSLLMGSLRIGIPSTPVVSVPLLAATAQRPIYFQIISLILRVLRLACLIILELLLRANYLSSSELSLGVLHLSLR